MHEPEAATAFFKPKAKFIGEFGEGEKKESQEQWQWKAKKKDGSSSANKKPTALIHFPAAGLRLHCAGQGIAWVCKFMEPQSSPPVLAVLAVP